MSSIDEIERDCSEQGWDSYGAQPVTQAALKAARGVWFVPTVRGGMQVEWTGPGGHWEAEWNPDGSLDSVFVAPTQAADLLAPAP